MTNLKYKDALELHKILGFVALFFAFLTFLIAFELSYLKVYILFFLIISGIHFLISYGLKKNKSWSIWLSFFGVV